MTAFARAWVCCLAFAPPAALYPFIRVRARVRTIVLCHNFQLEKSTRVGALGTTCVQGYKAASTYVQYVHRNVWDIVLEYHYHGMSQRS